MNLEHLTEEEILTKIEQGLVETVPADIVLRLVDYMYDRGFDAG